jgi:deazaflavin-dependent oxidoreductase (nitroreductase family)
MTTRRSARVYRFAGALGTSRLITRLHPVVYRATGGRGPFVGATLGMRHIIVGTTGRTSGRRIEVPLYAAADGERLVIIGSNGGKEKDPAWVANLRAQPEVTVRRGKREDAMLAREAEGEERDRLWSIATTAYPGYDDYAQRAAHRRIAVFALEPRD